MRTTLTIENRILRDLKEIAHRGPGWRRNGRPRSQNDIVSGRPRWQSSSLLWSR